jgi:hypothetical protein
LNQLVDFYEIQYGGYAIEGDFDAVLLSRTFKHSKMADVQTSEVDAKLAPVNVGL